MHSKTWIISAIIITLILGTLLGIITERIIEFRKMQDVKQWMAKDILDKDLLARLSQQLDLTQTQVQAIGGILRVQAQEIKQVRHNYKVKLTHIKEDTQEKIKKHLTEEQKQKYVTLIDLYRKRWEELWQEDESS